LVTVKGFFPERPTVLPSREKLTGQLGPVIDHAKLVAGLSVSD